jgi:hypothetical protein
LPKGRTKTHKEIAGLVLALASLTQPAAATILNCTTTKVTITSGLHGQTSSRQKEHLSFRIDDKLKTVKFLNNTPLAVTHFDSAWISAQYNDVSYDFDRQDGTLSYASSATSNNVTAVVVGSGRCAAIGNGGVGHNF